MIHCSHLHLLVSLRSSSLLPSQGWNCSAHVLVCRDVYWYEYIQRYQCHYWFCLRVCLLISILIPHCVRLHLYSEARGLCETCPFLLWSCRRAERQLAGLYLFWEFFCVYLFIYLFLSNFLEQLNHSVSFGCPLQQDYSLLNLLAAFSIILSYVSLPSCAFTSM